MIKKNKGCLCENLAIVWLQEQGYYVFKGSQTHCAIDLVAVDPTTLEHKFFDVKMLGKRKDGSIIARSPRIKDKRIQILSVDLINKKCRIVPKRKAIWN
jgi:Holliday junction resolvase-like predicted endonuclease|tara:strand:- start:714 stop:1010 length:297 start_codon:yes stop_codon:yes gene_type:complete